MAVTIMTHRAVGRSHIKVILLALFVLRCVAGEGETQTDAGRGDEGPERRGVSEVATEPGGEVEIGSTGTGVGDRLIATTQGKEKEWGMTDEVIKRAHVRETSLPIKGKGVSRAVSKGTESELGTVEGSTGENEGEVTITDTTPKNPISQKAEKTADEESKHWNIEEAQHISQERLLEHTGGIAVTDKHPELTREEQGYTLLEGQPNIRLVGVNDTTRDGIHDDEINSGEEKLKKPLPYPQSPFTLPVSDKRRDTTEEVAGGAEVTQIIQNSSFSFVSTPSDPGVERSYLGLPGDGVSRVNGSETGERKRGVGVAAIPGGVETRGRSREDVEDGIPHQPVSYKGDVVLKIVTPSRRHLLTLKSILQTHLPIEEIDIWRLPDEREKSVDVFVRCSRVEIIERALEEQGFTWTYLIRDVNKYIEREMWHRKKRATRTGDIVGKFVRLSRIESWLRRMSRIHSNVTTLHYIGTSHEGRPMSVLKIGRGSGPERSVWIDAGLHAREWIAPASAIFLIHKLLKNYRSDEEVRRYVEDYNWYFLVVANPDGYEHSFTKYRFWRKNRRPVDYNCTGVDLNRNWGYKWGGADASPNPCSVVYRGPSPESEPEVSNVINFLSSRRSDFILYFSLHSYGQKMLGRWAYADDVLPEDHDTLLPLAQRVARAMTRQHQRKYEAGTAAELMYPYSGGSADWARGELGVRYSYVAELRDEGVYGFLLPPEEIVPTGQEVWAGVKIFMRHIYKNNFIQTQTSTQASTVSVPHPTKKSIFLSNDSHTVTPSLRMTLPTSTVQDDLTLSQSVTSMKSYLVLPQQRNSAKTIGPHRRFCSLGFLLLAIIVLILEVL